MTTLSIKKRLRHPIFFRANVVIANATHPLLRTIRKISVNLPVAVAATKKAAKINSPS